VAVDGHSRKMTNDADARIQPGQIVTNPKVPEWGPGEVLSLEGKIARVRFKGLSKPSQVKVLSLEHVDLEVVQVPVSRPQAPSRSALSKKRAGKKGP
jgi:hypothetical protein